MTNHKKEYWEAMGIVIVAAAVGTGFAQLVLYVLLGPFWWMGLTGFLMMVGATCVIVFREKE